MLHMGAGDKEGVRPDVERMAVCRQHSVSRGDVMDFIAAASMAVGGNGSQKALAGHIDGLDGDAF